MCRYILKHFLVISISFQRYCTSSILCRKNIQVQSSQACVMGHKGSCRILLYVLNFKCTRLSTYHIMNIFTRQALSDNYSALFSLIDILLELVWRQSHNLYTLSCFWYHNYDRKMYTAVMLAGTGIAGYEYRKTLRDLIPCVILRLCHFSYYMLCFSEVLHPNFGFILRAKWLCRNHIGHGLGQWEEA